MKFDFGDEDRLSVPFQVPTDGDLEIGSVTLRRGHPEDAELLRDLRDLRWKLDNRFGSRPVLEELRERTLARWREHEALHGAGDAAWRWNFAETR